MPIRLEAQTMPGIWLDDKTGCGTGSTYRLEFKEDGTCEFQQCSVYESLLWFIKDNEVHLYDQLCDEGDPPVIILKDLRVDEETEQLCMVASGNWVEGVFYKRGDINGD